MVLKVQELFAETSAYFAITVVLSSFVRLLQAPTIFELALINPLVIFQIDIQVLQLFIGYWPPFSPTDLTAVGWNTTITFHKFYLILNTILMYPIILADTGISSTNGTKKQPLKQALTMLDLCDPDEQFENMISTIRYFRRGNVLFSLSPFFLAIWGLVSLAIRKSIEPDMETLGVDDTSTSPSMTPSATSPSPRKRHSTFVQRMVQRYLASIATLCRNDRILRRLILVLYMHLLCGISSWWICLLLLVFTPSLCSLMSFICARVLKLQRLSAWLRRLEEQIDGWIKESVAGYFSCTRITKLITLTLGAWIISQLGNMFSKIHTLRKELNNISQDDTQNDWGVGQVAAMVAWLPLITQLCKISSRSYLWPSLHYYLANRSRGN